MTLNLSEFQSLVRLLDDDSEAVRSGVAKRLLDYEDTLAHYTAQLTPQPPPEALATMHRIIREAKCETLADHWEDALRQTEPLARLEDALGLLADHLEGHRLRSGRLTGALDELAEALRSKAPTGLALAEALFANDRFTGNRDDYYAPQNSNLLQVVSTGVGNPISLSCLLMLLGHRLGHRIGGCNYPGHFLALIPRGEAPILVDCFNAGKILNAEDLLDTSMPEAANLQEVLFQPASPEAILLRVLRNLDRAYEEEGKKEEQHVFQELLERMLVAGLG